MNVWFLPFACIPCYDGILEDRPLGGTETAIVRLAEALRQRGHGVTVFTTHPGAASGFRQVDTIGAAEGCDVLLAVRGWQPLYSVIPAAVRVLWAHDAADSMLHLGLGDRRVVSRIDALLALSGWHAETLCSASGFPPKKTFVQPNGVHLPYFAGGEERRRKRLVYTSTPHRGLELLPSIWEQVKERHPEAELHVFSGFDVYAGGNGAGYANEAAYTRALKLLSGMSDVHVRGNVLQRELARELMRSAVLAYPNIFPETSCISAMEAQAAGCAVVTSGLGALPETVGEAGVIVSETPGTPAYERAFVEAVDRLLRDDALIGRLSANGRRRAENELGWDRRAASLEQTVAFVLAASTANGADPVPSPFSAPPRD